MPPAAIFLLSISMSVDAFAVSVGRGTSLTRHRIGEALRTGVVFGIVEAITPLLGWLAGMAASDWVADFDHWVAFALLTGVGLHMIHEALKGGPGRPAAERRPSMLVLIATAFGTSLDAMAVGLSLAFLDLELLAMVTVAAAIGIATFVMSTAGILLGRMIGNRMGVVAEILAGIVLCVLGSSILYEHLTA